MVSQNSSQQIEQPPAGHTLLLGRRGVSRRDDGLQGAPWIPAAEVRRLAEISMWWLAGLSKTLQNTKPSKGSRGVIRPYLNRRPTRAFGSRASPGSYEETQKMQGWCESLSQSSVCCRENPQGLTVNPQEPTPSVASGNFCQRGRTAQPLGGHWWGSKLKVALEITRLWDSAHREWGMIFPEDWGAVWCPWVTQTGWKVSPFPAAQQVNHGAALLGFKW